MIALPHRCLQRRIAGAVAMKLISQRSTPIFPSAEAARDSPPFCLLSA